MYEAQIRKEHILALFTGRNESEVVVDPRHLEQIMESPEPGFDMQMTDVYKRQVTGSSDMVDAKEGSEYNGLEYNGSGT